MLILLLVRLLCISFGKQLKNNAFFNSVAYVMAFNENLTISRIFIVAMVGK